MRQFAHRRRTLRRHAADALHRQGIAAGALHRVAVAEQAFHGLCLECFAVLRCRLSAVFSSRSKHFLRCSAVNSFTNCRYSTSAENWTSTAPPLRWPTKMPSAAGKQPSTGHPGWCTANGPSVARSRSSNIWAATPTESPSATSGSLLSKTGASPSPTRTTRPTAHKRR
jgi:hypothetical protein